MKPAYSVGIRYSASWPSEVSTPEQNRLKAYTKNQQALTSGVLDVQIYTCKLHSDRHGIWTTYSS